MNKKIRRKIDRFSGHGSFSKEGVTLGPVDYQIDVWQDFVVFGASPADELPGLKHLEIRASHQLDVFQLWQDQTTIRLHLEDGKYLDGFLDGSKFIPGGQLMNADGSQAE